MNDAGFNSKLGESDALLYSALIDSNSSVATAFEVHGLAVCDSVTVVFHARKDLGAVHTYLAQGSLPVEEPIELGELLRVPCDLDLAGADGVAEAALLYTEQAAAVRDAVIGADAALSIWQEALLDLAGGSLAVDPAARMNLRIPGHRLLPTAVVVPERSMAVVAVCSSRTLAEGMPPLGIACVQPDLSRIYGLSDDPASCIDDFLEHASEYALSLQERLDRQEITVDRFLELGG